MSKDAIRWGAIVAAVLVAGGGLWMTQILRAAGADTNAPSSQPADRAQKIQNVEVVTPRRATMSRILDVPGTIEAYEKADLYAKVAGYVSEVQVDIGDRVKQGQGLAVLDIPEMASDLLEAQARQAAGTASLEEARAKVVESQKMLDLARSQLRRYQAELTLKETTFRRRDELFKGKAITEQDLDEVRSQYETAKAEAAVAEARIAAAEANVSSAEAAQAVAAAQVKLAEAQVERVRTMMDYARIVAPFDGVITRRLIDRGALVQAATNTRSGPLFTIQRIDQVRIFVEAPESDLANLKAGSTAKVKPYGWSGEPFEGTVARTSSSLNAQTRTMRTEIDVLNPKEQLLDGMYAQIEIRIDERANALTIPASSILTENNKPFVYTVEGDRAVRKTIETGIDDGLRIEVRRGLSDDDRVIVTGQGLIGDGVAVRAVLKPSS